MNNVYSYKNSSLLSSTPSQKFNYPTTPTAQPSTSPSVYPPTHPPYNQTIHPSQPKIREARNQDDNPIWFGKIDIYILEAISVRESFWLNQF